MIKKLSPSMPEELYTAQQVRRLDAIAIDEHGIAGIILMRRAAMTCVDVITAQWPSLNSCAVYCGSGNNAGDGYIIGALLAERGIEVQILILGDTGKLSTDATTAYEFARQSSASLVPVISSGIESISSTEPDLIVDALLGTGLSGSVRPLYQTAISFINGSSCPVLSVDIPSGLSADTGEQLNEAVMADHTVTFIGLKQGLFTLDGPDCVGHLHFDQLGLPEENPSESPAESQADIKVRPSCRKLDLKTLQGGLLPRPKNAHKNNFGHLLVIGGDEGMGGAIAMAAVAAMRSGAGLVSVATHPEHKGTILATHPEIMVHGVSTRAQLEPLLAKATALILGPGLGRSDWSKVMFGAVMKRKIPMVLDADGLNLLADSNDLKRDDWVLTPHPGEASRLAKDQSNQSDRFKTVRSLQQQYGGVVLLKGVGTLIADSAEMSLCPYGNPGMSTAGMGDVLSGVIGGLIAQGLSTVKAAELGAVVHSVAADLCTQSEGERGLMATDLMPYIRRLLNPELNLAPKE